VGTWEINRSRGDPERLGDIAVSEQNIRLGVSQAVEFYFPRIEEFLSSSALAVIA
jgi:hypothetical protein